ncbi:4-hydroxybenzoyl-CoA thioesterase [Neokomagataea thailandica NBRC 106555]|uniref:Tol-pal system-associated acyl-CoA thioesterase n=2 Tax=Neokomagataea TaxID=1223423 RepID=A0A4Y6V2V4_9PROT|nr:MULTISPECIES: tol-pal system-associated acyl-CoA thioesterase [Neokomagataea]QDH24313.1 tol-pal system-associated acyl-CoA thioesterase [Neokomagataea tanensis]GBR53118.1 4-hydroxybenzoyl-CoA thioesterase [Neokomagataea thailandica NBRC 106555]
MATHKIRFRVYYEDTDAGGIVYHARYLAFAERARSEAMRSANAAVTELLETDGIGFVVRQVGVRYRTPLRLEDMMEVETALIAITPARLKLKQTIRNAEKLDEEAVVLDVELACIEMNTLKPARIPPRWCDAIRKLEAGVH